MRRINAFSHLAFLIMCMTGYVASAQIAVTDPILNSSTIAQTKEIVRGITVATDSLEQVGNINQNLTGSLQDAKELIDGIKDAQNIVRDGTRTYMRLKDQNGNPISRRNIKDIQRGLDLIYGTSPANRATNIEEVQKHRQTAIKSSLETSEVMVNRSEEDTERLNDLVSEIDDKDTLKYAIDHNSKLQAELLRVDIETQNLLAQFIRMESAEAYQGVETDVAQIEQRELLSDQLARGARNAYGLRVESCPDVMKRLGQC